MWGQGQPSCSVHKNQHDGLDRGCPGARLGVLGWGEKPGPNRRGVISWDPATHTYAAGLARFRHEKRAGAPKDPGPLLVGG